MSRQTASTPSQDKNTRSRSKAAINQKGGRTRSAGSASSTSVRRASQYNHHAPILEQVQGPSQTALRKVMSNFTTPQHDSSDYPPMPKVSQGQAAIQCPFCFIVWEQTNSESVNLGLWKLHIDEHIKPYSCLFPRCAISLTSFVHQQEWEDHMESVHPSGWLREVHTKQWYCDSGHESTFTFELEAQWREHVLDPASHPERQETPNRFQLKALSQLKQRRVRRDMHVCLLQQLLTYLQVNRLTSNMRPLPNKEEGWDDDFVGYRQPNEAPESTRHSWTDYLPRCKYEQDPEVLKLLGRYPVPKHLGSSETQTSTTDVDFQDDVGQTALSLAAQGDYIETMRRLIIMGGDIELADRDGKTPLCWAAAEGKESAVKFLMDIGARIEATEHIYGRTSLSWAAARGHSSVLRVLCTYGAHVNALDKSKRTPMSPKNASLLLQHGAAINAIDGSSKTPLCLASQDGYAAVVEVLLKNGADIETLHPKYAQTPLSLASGGGYEDVVRLLLEHRAKIDAKYSQGKTARDWAIEEIQN
ncbi:ankyrin repeat [Fusarium agapanthi]|uniref:Ankyrin repeat n=1 Tax=Fusarium agapanthi TaxID=1803897 RepID=A0A9P5AW47_9HYPO|nr:ankyrin repeat [Fusarium agapanthi]